MAIDWKKVRQTAEAKDAFTKRSASADFTKAGGGSRPGPNTVMGIMQRQGVSTPGQPGQNTVQGIMQRQEEMLQAQRSSPENIAAFFAATNKSPTAVMERIAPTPPKPAINLAGFEKPKGLDLLKAGPEYMLARQHGLNTMQQGDGASALRGQAEYWGNLAKVQEKNVNEPAKDLNALKLASMFSSGADAPFGSAFLQTDTYSEAKRETSEKLADNSEKYRGYLAKQNEALGQSYASLMNSPDFGLLSGGVIDGEKDDYRLKRINGEQNTSMTLNNPTLAMSAGFDKLRTGGLDYLTDDERAVYNYLYNTQGKDAANDFVGFIENELNSRYGKKLAGDVRGSVLGQYAVGFVGGLDRSGAGIAQLFDKDVKAQSPLQHASGQIRQDLAGKGPQVLGSSLGQMGFDAANTVGNMAPAILISALTGGAAGPALGAAYTGLSTGGNAYASAVNEGFTPAQARTYGTLVGAAEGGLQYLIGGIGKLGGVADDVLLAKVQGIDNALARIALTGAIKVGSEVTEENLQDILEPAFRTLVTGEEYDAPTFEQLAYTTLLTALTTGVLESGEIAAAGRNTNTAPNAGPVANAPASGKIDAVQTFVDALGGNTPTPANGAVAQANAVADAGAGFDVGKAFSNPEYRAQVAENATLLLPEQSAVAGAQGLPMRVDNAEYKVVEIPQAKIDEINAYIESSTTPETKKHFKKIIKNLFMGQKFTNANTVANNLAYEIGVGSKGIGEIISHQPVNAETLAMLEQLNEIVENAKWMASEPSNKGDKRIHRTDIFETDTLVGNDPGVARMRVNVSDNGNNLYFATNQSNSGIKAQPRGGVNQQRGIELSPPVTTNSIPQMPQNSNSNLQQNAMTENGKYKNMLDNLVSQGATFADVLDVAQQNNDVDFYEYASTNYGQDASGKMYKLSAQEHIDNRTNKSVAQRKLPAFQYQHPHLHHFFVDAANMLKANLELAMSEVQHVRGQGTVTTNNELTNKAQALGLSRPELVRVLDDIINNHGSENYAAAKRVELLLDEMLSDGFTSLVDENGQRAGSAKFSANDAYLVAKEQIKGAEGVDNRRSRQGAELNAWLDAVEPGFPEGMGAASNPYRTESKRSRTESNTLQRLDEAEGVPEEARQKINYDTLGEAQSLENARQRLGLDYEGEAEHLKNTTAWTGEEIDAAFLVRKNERQSAEQSGDWRGFQEWRREIRQHGSEAGRSLQAFEKWTRTLDMTADNLIDNAADILDMPREKGKRKVVSDELANKTLGDVANYALKAEEQFNAGDVEGLTQTVIDLAAQRGYKPAKGTINRLGKIDINSLYDVAWLSIEGLALDAIPPSVGRKISTYQYMSHLFNAKTLIRNVVANTVFAPLDNLSTNIGLIPDAVVSYIMSKKRGISFQQARAIGYEQGYLSKAARSGMVEGARNSSIDIELDIDRKNDGNKYEANTGRTFNRYSRDSELTGGTAIWDAVLNGKYGVRNIPNNVEGALSYGLNWTDEVQKGATKAISDKALNPLVESGGRVTPELAEKMTENAQLYRSFQRETVVGNLLQVVKDYANVLGIGTDNGKTVGIKKLRAQVKDFGLGDFISKYTRVAGALPTTFVEYTPIGYAKALYNLGAMVHANSMETRGYGESTNKAFGYSDLTNSEAAVMAQRDFAQSIGRATTGTGLIMAFSALAKLGILIFMGGDDRDEESMLSSVTGQSGLQLNLSALGRLIEGEDTALRDGDILMSQEYLQPVNGMMELGARMDELGDAEFEQQLDAVVQTAINSISELPMMGSLNTVTNNVRFKKDDETWSDVAGKTALQVLSDSASGFVPAPVRQTAQAMDDSYRSTLGDDIGRRSLNSLKNAIPGLRETLPVKFDSFGNEKKYSDNPLLNAFNAYIAPGNVATYRQNSVADELQRVSKIADASLYPDSSAPKALSFSSKGEKYTYELTADERNAYTKTMGAQVESLVQAALASDIYKGMSDKQKAEVISNVISYARDEAKTQLLDGRDVERESDWDKIRGLSDIPAYLSYKQVLSDASKEGATAEAYTTMDSVLNYYPKLKNDVKEQLSRLDGFDKIKEIVSVGGSSQWYFDYKKYVKEIDDNGSITQLEAAQAIERMRIEKEYKGALWQLQNSTWKEEKNPYTGTLAQAGFAPSKVIAIAEKFSEIDNEYSDWIRDEGKTLPTRNALKTSLFKAWLQSQGYIGDTIDLIMDEYIYWQMVPASETKQSESYVRANPSLIK